MGLVLQVEIGHELIFYTDCKTFITSVNTQDRCQAPTLLVTIECQVELALAHQFSRNHTSHLTCQLRVKLLHQAKCGLQSFLIGLQILTFDAGVQEALVTTREIVHTTTCKD